MSLFSELKRRNVFKVGIAYIALCWVVVQATDIIVPALNLPESLNSIVVYLGLIGFPFAIFFSWAFELTPDGVVRAGDVEEEASITHSTGRKIDFIIIGALVIVVIFLIMDRGAVEDVDVAADGAIPVNSIAVLPFVNMSSDPEQEYFSDGISEEILNVLSQIKDLQVTSRSSSFSFKGQNLDTPTMAKQLGVSKILEGSVRKSGDRIRITAQLIEAETDVHLWSETYDRDLSDIFAVQDEISIAIVDALRTTLNIDVAEADFEQGTSNTEAYDEFLLGTYFLNQGGLENNIQAKNHLERATELDPDYAQAWAMLSTALPNTTIQINNAQFDEITEQQSLALNKALSINPELGMVQFAQGIYYYRQREFTIAQDHFERTVELDPNFADAYDLISVIQVINNQHLEAHNNLLIAVKIDPMSLFVNLSLSDSYARFEKFDEAQAILNRMMQIHSASPFPVLVELELLFKKGQYAETVKKYRDLLDQGVIIDVNYRYRTAVAMATIGLYDETIEIQAGGVNETQSYSFVGEYDEYIERARTNYAADTIVRFPAMSRALAELYAGNYQLAQEIYQIFAPCSRAAARQDFCQMHYFAERKLGNSSQAEIYLQRLKILEIRADREGWRLTRMFPSEIFIANTLVYSGDIDQALAIYKDQLNKGFFAYYILEPIFKELHDHPDWLAFLAEIRVWQAAQRAKLAELEGI